MRQLGFRRSDIDESIPKFCCCLCRDVAFANALLRCHHCGYRLQHRYCSRFYPDKIDKDNWGCEWCIHREEGETKKTMKGNDGAHNAKGLMGQKKSSKRWIGVGNLQGRPSFSWGVTGDISSLLTYSALN